MDNNRNWQGWAAVVLAGLALFVALGGRHGSDGPPVQNWVQVQPGTGYGQGQAMPQPAVPPTVQPPVYAPPAQAGRRDAQVIQTPTRTAPDFSNIDGLSGNLTHRLHISDRRRTRHLWLKRADVDVDDLLILHAGIIPKHLEVLAAGVGVRIGECLLIGIDV